MSPPLAASATTWLLVTMWALVVQHPTRPGALARPRLDLDGHHARHGLGRDVGDRPGRPGGRPHQRSAPVPESSRGGRGEGHLPVGRQPAPSSPPPRPASRAEAGDEQDRTSRGPWRGALPGEEYWATGCGGTGGTGATGSAGGDAARAPPRWPAAAGWWGRQVRSGRAGLRGGWPRGPIAHRCRRVGSLRPGGLVRPLVPRGTWRRRLEPRSPAVETASPVASRSSPAGVDCPCRRGGGAQTSPGRGPQGRPTLRGGSGHLGGGAVGQGSRSWARPRWIRDRTVPSLMSRTSATSS